MSGTIESLKAAVQTEVEDVQKLTALLLKTKAELAAEKAARSKVEAERDEALALAYVGGHQFPDQSWKARADELIRDSCAAQKRIEALESQIATVREALPDDLRANGWAVAVHNDYRLNGIQHTFWLLVKDGRAVKGEGFYDAAALAQIRAALAPPSESAPQPGRGRASNMPMPEAWGCVPFPTSDPAPPPAPQDKKK